MKTIIPIRSKTNYIKDFQRIFQNPLFVFDRCQIPTDFKGEYKQTNLDLPNHIFMAGYARDIGAAGIDDDILFLDQDKVPTENPENKINELKDKYDCIIFYLQNKDPRLLHSRFDENHNLVHYIIEPEKEHDFIPWTTYAEPRNGVYTAGIWLSKKVLPEIRELNQGRIFNSNFDGNWGEEDRFLGDELAILGYRIGYIRDIRLQYSGVSNSMDKMDEFSINFSKRLQLRKMLSPLFYEPNTKIEWGVRKL
jgi:hypothetical protein